MSSCTEYHFAYQGLVRLGQGRTHEMATRRLDKKWRLSPVIRENRRVSQIKQEDQIVQLGVKLDTMHFLHRSQARRSTRASNGRSHTILGH
jgi:hypothetical protein